MPVSGIKAQAHALLADLARTGDANRAYHSDALAMASHPWGVLEGASAIGRLWAVLRAALPDMERRDLIFVGGENRDDPRLDAPRAPHMVAALGHLQGTFATDLLGIPATHGVVHLRYGEAHWIDGGKIRRSWLHFDLVDLMEQAGLFPLPPPFGARGIWPGPAPQDGLRLGDEAWDGPDALDTVFAMHAALLSFDGKSLSSMPHDAYWTGDFMYYAAGGIGMTRGLAGFRAHHQIPFLKAFPDRTSEGHFIRISDGPYAVTGGVVLGTHLGPYLGMTPTGRRIRMPVMDFYRLEGTRIAENWLPMDVLGVAHQMGNDLLARLAHYRGDPARDL
ncbi:ester cyclase [Ovoidimarina sediminis]|uniref:ester cyclase n=1 Tax=Ovoidimarina sediminis TaxID=3079856 RepID=UPI00290EDDDA|nr:ester cyclase [Rhodophyticola sp. MJ-SS7]MDU8946557.1 ester cyclase [Rhodophyticola sp. MJ-SS7]